MPHGPHAMMGHGGKIRVPLSETVELQKAWEILENLRWNKIPDSEVEGIQRAMAILSRLRTQVSAGYHRNPRGLQFQAGTVIGKIGTDVHDVRYTHESDGKSYEHQFGGEAEVWAVQRNNKRELLITHVRGLPLWEDF